MKLLLETWKKYLTEICGDTDPYDFKFHNQFSDGDVHFEFETDTGLQYFVIFRSINKLFNHGDNR